MSVDLAYERAAAGAKLLDAKLPDWWQPHFVDLEKLDLLSARACVLGQVYGVLRNVGDGYAVGYYVLLNSSAQMAQELGFLPMATDFFLDGAYLENAWRDLILSRRVKAEERQPALLGF